MGAVEVAVVDALQMRDGSLLRHRYAVVALFQKSLPCCAACGSGSRGGDSWVVNSGSKLYLQSEGSSDSGDGGGSGLGGQQSVVP